MPKGIVYVRTADGAETAVIDVTNEAFAVTATEEELAAIVEKYILEAEQWKELPEAVREALRNSKLGRALMAASGTFLDGLTTYYLKLGPEHLGEWATPIDRRIAASFPAFAARLRLQDMAQLLAEGVGRVAEVEPGRRVCLVNVAGGPGADSWNALIRLHEGKVDKLAGRKVGIILLDQDARGPEFGRKAVEGLCEDGGPLSGVRVEFRHCEYAWSDAGRLVELLEELEVRGAACGISSEGGLFEYGSDGEIVANLKALRAGTPRDSLVVGSVTRDGAVVRASLIASRVATRPRTMEGFRGLCEQAGWSVERVIERPFSYHVRLMKS